MAAFTGKHSDERDAYHHGNMRESLLEGGVELARAGGPSAVLLRAASRRAGVSHNAVYRHFASQEDLLAAVAKQCMSQLALLMIQRSGQVTANSPIQQAQARLTAIGRAYVDFARAEPGWFRTAFCSARSHETGRSRSAASRADHLDTEQRTDPYLILAAHLDELVEVGALDPRHRLGAEYPVWSSIHGLASLLLDGPLRALPEERIEDAFTSACAAIALGLRLVQPQSAVLSAAELAASRTRIAAAADGARRRIERDLHDGAQQRLVSLLLRVRSATLTLAGDPKAAEELDILSEGLSGAIDELREIAHGIHPAILARGGLSAALRALARRSAAPVQLTVHVDGRLPDPIELAAYYSVAEALTNAAKHAEATGTYVDAHSNGSQLRIEIRDDGRGGADFGGGSGLVGIKDRIEAVNGCFHLSSPPGRGTTVTLVLPATVPSA